MAVRSLYSAVSGLINEQLSMDVIGNNIANTNTVGFKASNTDFEEAFNQTSRTANQTVPVGLDVGLGVITVGTTTNYTQGAFQQTGIESNIGISGNGFFEVTTQSNTTASATPNGNVLYTRAGDFVVDLNGNLRTPDGNYVQGYTGTGTTGGFTATLPAGYTAPTAPGATPLAAGSLSNIQIPTSVTTSAVGVTPPVTEPVDNYTIGTNGAITVVTSSGSQFVIGYVPLTSFANEDGLNDTGGGYYATTPATGTATIWGANNGPVGTTQAGTLELSNSDVATQFSNMIITQEGYNGDAKVITTTNEMMQVADNLIQ